MNHEGEDAHLGGAAVVELDGEFLVDGLLIPSGCVELCSFDVLLADAEADLDEADEGNNLGDACSGDCVKGSKTVLDR